MKTDPAKTGWREARAGRRAYKFLYLPQKGLYSRPAGVGDDATRRSTARRESGASSAYNQLGLSANNTGG